MLGVSVRMQCCTVQSGYRVESDTEHKSQASGGSQVLCGGDGQFVYPAVWPQCSASVSCPDPGHSAGVARTVTAGTELQYDSVLQWTCQDPRYGELHVANLP